MRGAWDEQDLWIDPARLATGGHATKFTGTTGDDRIVGTDGRDRFDVYQGGDDIVKGGDGNDVVNFQGSFSLGDFVNGGAGRDKIRIAGDYHSDIELDPALLKHVERIEFLGQRHYSVIVDDGFSQLRVEGSALATLFVNASLVKSGNVDLTGDVFADTLLGGAGNDRIVGGENSSPRDVETLTGGSGSDKFVYLSDADSPPASQFSHPDLITDFSQNDYILLPEHGGLRYSVTTESGQAGNINVEYNAYSNTTMLNVFTNDDGEVDMAIILAGSHVDIKVVHGSYIVDG